MLDCGCVHEFFWAGRIFAKPFHVITFTSDFVKEGTPIVVCIHRRKHGFTFFFRASQNKNVELHKMNTTRLDKVPAQLLGLGAGTDFPLDERLSNLVGIS